MHCSDYFSQPGPETQQGAQDINCITGVPPVLTFVPPALVICPTIPDKIYGETYSKVVKNYL